MKKLILAVLLATTATSAVAAMDESRETVGQWYPVYKACSMDGYAEYNHAVKYYETEWRTTTRGLKSKVKKLNDAYDLGRYCEAYLGDQEYYEQWQPKVKKPLTSTKIDVEQLKEVVSCATYYDNTGRKEHAESTFKPLFEAAMAADEKAAMEVVMGTGMVMGMLIKNGLTPELKSAFETNCSKF